MFNHSKGQHNHVDASYEMIDNIKTSFSDATAMANSKAVNLYVSLNQSNYISYF